MNKFYFVIHYVDGPEYIVHEFRTIEMALKHIHNMLSDNSEHYKFEDLVLAEAIPVQKITEYNIHPYDDTKNYDKYAQAFTQENMEAWDNKEN